jgi:Tfp pilus assembly protein PilX
MQRENRNSLRSKRRRARQDERGVALITTLLLLMLLTGLTLAMAWSSRSDMLINGYYRNFRGSFYAADSGINIMRQAMIPLFQPGGAAYPASFAVGTNPLPPGTEATVIAALTGAYGTKSVSGSGTGTAAMSWPGNYTASLTFTLQSCTTDVPLTPLKCSPWPAAAKTATYIYAYTITSTGKSKGTESTVLTDSGTFMVTATIPTPAKLSFAGYGMFIDQYNLCDGTTLVPGTITGPVFTNGSWNFGTGQYTLTDTLGQAGPTVGTSNCPTGATVLPANVTDPQGFKPGQPKVTLPKNSFNQEQAVLDGKGANADGSAVPQPSRSALNNGLRNVNKTRYPSSGSVPDGVYLPYTVNSGGNNPTFNGGGIMVSGDASVILSPTATGKGQIYTITQGSTTTTITIDPVLNTTLVSSGGTNLTISGVPHQFDPSAGTDLGPDTMLYVDGNITKLSGPGQGQAAIQDGTALTITAASNVTITGDLLYKSEPVTGTPSTPSPTGTPIDSLISLNDTGQALGIFTATGDIQMDNKQANGNLEIDASLATISDLGTGGLTNVGNLIQTLTIVGGRIQNNIKNINANQRNVLFDKRFANGLAPPWFPSTGIVKGNNSANLNVPVLTRLQWLNKNNYF